MDNPQLTRYRERCLRAHVLELTRIWPHTARGLAARTGAPLGSTRTLCAALRREGLLEIAGVDNREQPPTFDGLGEYTYRATG